MTHGEKGATRDLVEMEPDLDPDFTLFNYRTAPLKCEMSPVEICCAVLNIS